jgi:hypothetical protein
MCHSQNFQNLLGLKRFHKSDELVTMLEDNKADGSGERVLLEFELMKRNEVTHLTEKHPMRINSFDFVESSDDM